MKQFRVELPDRRKILVDVESLNVSVARMRKNIADILNLADSAIRLYYKSKELKGRLSDYSFTEKSVIPLSLSFAVIPLHRNPIQSDLLDQLVFGERNHIKFTDADKRKWVQTRSAIINWWVQILTFEDFIKEFVDPSYFNNAESFQSILEQFVDEAVSRLERIVFRRMNGELSRDNLSCITFAVIGSVIQDFLGVDDLAHEFATWNPVCPEEFLSLMMEQASSVSPMRAPKSKKKSTRKSRVINPKKQVRVVSPKSSLSDPVARLKKDLQQLAAAKQKNKASSQQFQSLNDWKNVSNKLKTLYKDKLTKQARVISERSELLDRPRVLNSAIQQRHDELLKLANRARTRDTQLVQEPDNDEYIAMRRRQLEQEKSQKEMERVMKKLKDRIRK